jgi:hypothetical protein
VQLLGGKAEEVEKPIEEQLKDARAYIVRCDLLLAQSVIEVEGRDTEIKKRDETIAHQHKIIKNWERKSK